MKGENDDRRFDEVEVEGEMGASERARWRCICHARASAKAARQEAPKDWGPKRQRRRAQRRLGPQLCWCGTTKMGGGTAALEDATEVPERREEGHKGWRAREPRDEGHSRGGGGLDECGCRERAERAEPVAEVEGAKVRDKTKR